MRKEIMFDANKDKNDIINSLLNSYRGVDDMMKELALSSYIKTTLEDIRRKSVEVLTFISNTGLPISADTKSFSLLDIKLELGLIPKFTGKVHSELTPLDFFELHYQGTGVTQITLRNIDEKLLNSMKYQARELQKVLSDFVPPGTTIKKN